MLTEKLTAHNFRYNSQTQRAGTLNSRIPDRLNWSTLRKHSNGQQETQYQDSHNPKVQ